MSEPRDPTGDSQAEAMFRASDVQGSGFIRGVTFRENPKRVEFTVINGRAIFEGDINLGDADTIPQSPEISEDDSGLALGVAVTGERFRWPCGLVPWEAEAALRDRALAAIRHWEERTNIRFVERTAANEAQHLNYLSFRALDGCWSSVGMQGGPQIISLGAGCGLGQAIHEIGHALGLWHEQSREDRDNFVTINFANIQPGRESQFTQRITDGDDVGAYDYDSIMHYGPTAFSGNGQPTITANNGAAIGQRSGLSANDIATIRALYPMLEPSRSWSGVQFTGSVAAHQTRSWFTHSWPSYWFVLWTVVPTAPVQDRAPQIEWKVQVERQSDALLKYYLRVTNLTAGAVSIEARYEVLGWNRCVR